MHSHLELRYLTGNQLKRHSTPVLMFTFSSLKIDQNEELSPFGLLNLKQNLLTIRKK